MGVALHAGKQLAHGRLERISARRGHNPLTTACQHTGTLGTNQIIQLMNEIPVTMRSTDTVPCRLPIIYKCAELLGCVLVPATLLHAGPPQR
jgi:hypothetical protein